MRTATPWVSLAILLACTCCRPAEQPPVPQEAPSPTGDQPIPLPDLSRLSQEVRSRLEAKHADGESAIREADGTGRRAEIWGDLGKPYHAFGVIDTAEACYRRARHVDVASGAALYRLGRVLAAKGDDEGAAARFEAALTIQPAATRIDCGLGQSYRNPGRMEDASREMARFGRGEVVGGDALLAELGRLTSGTGGGRLASGRAALQMVQGTGRPAP